MHLFLRDRIAQLILVRFGSNISPEVEAAEDFARVAKLVERYKIGGVALFHGGTAVNTHNLLLRLQTVTVEPLLVAADMERGLAQQTTDLEAWPHALAFDALGVDATADVEEFARLSASEARALGVHVSFSPVADIHRNLENPIIANRAFGTSAARTAELAAAYIRGCHAGGLLCCAKHFPGHGSTTEDSHEVLPRVTEPLDKLSHTDLVPFRKSIVAGTDLVMTAHVAYPKLDPTGYPATLSPVILTDMLRKEWGYEGAIITDSMQMAGVRQQADTEGEVAVAAVRAGVDLLLDVGDVAGVIGALERAAAADPNLVARIDDAYQRGQRLKHRAQSLAAAAAAADSRSAHQHALSVARRALTIVSDDGRLALPVDPSRQIGVLLLNPLGDDTYTGTNRIQALFRTRPRTEVCVLASAANPTERQNVLERLAACDMCLVAMAAKPADWHTTVVGWQAELIQRVIAMRPTIVASLGVADGLDNFPEAAMQVVTYSDVPVCQRALYDRITVA